MKTKCVSFSKTGGPEVLQYEEKLLGEPGNGEVLIQHHAIGVNFIDTYFRSGLYQTALPAGLGFEAAGIVEKVGEGVTHIKIGDRVAYGQGPLGSYSERRIMPANVVV